jgi:hypothetical protein
MEMQMPFWYPTDISPPRLPHQIPERHARYLILRNVRDAPTFAGAVVAGLRLPWTAARRAVAALLPRFRSPAASLASGTGSRCNFIEPNKNTASAPTAAATLGRSFSEFKSDVDIMPGAPLVAKATAAVAGGGLHLTSEDDLDGDGSLRAALRGAFCEAMNSPPLRRPLTGAHLRAEAAAAAAADPAGVGGAWATALPFSAAVRGRWFFVAALALASAALVRFGVAVAVVVADDNIKVQRLFSHSFSQETVSTVSLRPNRV